MMIKNFHEKWKNYDQSFNVVSASSSRGYYDWKMGRTEASSMGIINTPLHVLHDFSAAWFVNPMNTIGGIIGQAVAIPAEFLSSGWNTPGGMIHRINATANYMNRHMDDVMSQARVDSALKPRTPDLFSDPNASWWDYHKWNINLNSVLYGAIQGVESIRSFGYIGKAFQVSKAALATTRAAQAISASRAGVAASRALGATNALVNQTALGRGTIAAMDASARALSRVPMTKRALQWSWRTIKDSRPGIIMEFPSIYQDARNGGMGQIEALVWSTAAATSAGVLESIIPNKILKGEAGQFFGKRMKAELAMMGKSMADLTANEINHIAARTFANTASSFLRTMGRETGGFIINNTIEGLTEAGQGLSTKMWKTFASEHFNEEWDNRAGQTAMEEFVAGVFGGIGMGGKEWVQGMREYWAASDKGHGLDFTVAEAIASGQGENLRIGLIEAYKSGEINADLFAKAMEQANAYERIIEQNMMSRDGEGLRLTDWAEAVRKDDGKSGFTITRFDNKTTASLLSLLHAKDMLAEEAQRVERANKANNNTLHGNTGQIHEKVKLIDDAIQKLVSEAEQKEKEAREKGAEKKGAEGEFVQKPAVTDEGTEKASPAVVALAIAAGMDPLEAITAPAEKVEAVAMGISEEQVMELRKERFALWYNSLTGKQSSVGTSFSRHMSFLFEMMDTMLSANPKALITPDMVWDALGNHKDASMAVTKKEAIMLWQLLVEKPGTSTELTAFNMKTRNLKDDTIKRQDKLLFRKDLLPEIDTQRQAEAEADRLKEGKSVTLEYSPREDGNGRRFTIRHIEKPSPSNPSGVRIIEEILDPNTGDVIEMNEVFFSRDLQRHAAIVNGLSTFDEVKALLANSISGLSYQEYEGSDWLATVPDHKRNNGYYTVEIKGLRNKQTQSISKVKMVYPEGPVVQYVPNSPPDVSQFARVLTWDELTQDANIAISLSVLGYTKDNWKEMPYGDATAIILAGINHAALSNSEHAPRKYEFTGKGGAKYYAFAYQGEIFITNESYILLSKDTYTPVEHGKKIGDLIYEITRTLADPTAQEAGVGYFTGRTLENIDGVDSEFYHIDGKKYRRAHSVMEWFLPAFDIMKKSVTIAAAYANRKASLARNNMVDLRDLPTDPAKLRERWETMKNMGTNIHALVEAAIKGRSLESVMEALKNEWRLTLKPGNASEQTGIEYFYEQIRQITERSERVLAESVIFDPESGIATRVDMLEFLDDGSVIIHDFKTKEVYDEDGKRVYKGDAQNLNAHIGARGEKKQTTMMEYQMQLNIQKRILEKMGIRVAGMKIHAIHFEMSFSEEGTTYSMDKIIEHDILPMAEGALDRIFEQAQQKKETESYAEEKQQPYTPPAEVPSLSGVTADEATADLAIPDDAVVIEILTEESGPVEIDVVIPAKNIDDVSEGSPAIATENEKKASEMPSKGWGDDVDKIELKWGKKKTFVVKNNQTLTWGQMFSRELRNMFPHVTPRVSDEIVGKYGANVIGIAIGSLAAVRPGARQSDMVHEYMHIWLLLTRGTKTYNSLRDWYYKNRNVQSLNSRKHLSKEQRDEVNEDNWHKDVEVEGRFDDKFVGSFEEMLIRDTQIEAWKMLRSKIQDGPFKQLQNHLSAWWSMLKMSLGFANQKDIFKVIAYGFAYRKVSLRKQQAYHESGGDKIVRFQKEDTPGFSRYKWKMEKLKSLYITERNRLEEKKKTGEQAVIPGMETSSAQGVQRDAALEKMFESIKGIPADRRNFPEDDIKEAVFLSMVKFLPSEFDTSPNTKAETVAQFNEVYEAKVVGNKLKGQKVKFANDGTPITEEDVIDQVSEEALQSERVGTKKMATFNPILLEWIYRDLDPKKYGVMGFGYGKLKSTLVAALSGTSPTMTFGERWQSLLSRLAVMSEHSGYARMLHDRLQSLKPFDEYYFQKHQEMVSEEDAYPEWVEYRDRAIEKGEPHDLFLKWYSDKLDAGAIKVTGLELMKAIAFDFGSINIRKVAIGEWYFSDKKGGLVYSRKDPRASGNLTILSNHSREVGKYIGALVESFSKMGPGALAAAVSEWNKMRSVVHTEFMKIEAKKNELAALQNGFEPISTEQEEKLKQEIADMQSAFVSDILPKNMPFHYQHASMPRSAPQPPISMDVLHRAMSMMEGGKYYDNLYAQFMLAMIKGAEMSAIAMEQQSKRTRLVSLFEEIGEIVCIGDRPNKSKELMAVLNEQQRRVNKKNEDARKKNLRSFTPMKSILEMLSSTIVNGRNVIGSMQHGIKRIMDAWMDSMDASAMDIERGTTFVNPEGKRESILEKMTPLHRHLDSLQYRKNVDRQWFDSVYGENPIAGDLTNTEVVQISGVEYKESGRKYSQFTQNDYVMNQLALFHSKSEPGRYLHPVWVLEAANSHFALSIKKLSEQEAIARIEELMKNPDVRKHIESIGSIREKAAKYATAITGKYAEARAKELMEETAKLQRKAERQEEEGSHLADKTKSELEAKRVLLEKMKAARQQLEADLYLMFLNDVANSPYVNHLMYGEFAPFGGANNQTKRSKAFASTMNYVWNSATEDLKQYRVVVFKDKKVTHEYDKLKNGEIRKEKLTDSSKPTDSTAWVSEDFSRKLASAAASKVTGHERVYKMSDYGPDMVPTEGNPATGDNFFYLKAMSITLTKSMALRTVLDESSEGRAQNKNNGLAFEFQKQDWMDVKLAYETDPQQFVNPDLVGMWIMMNDPVTPIDIMVPESGAKKIPGGYQVQDIWQDGSVKVVDGLTSFTRSTFNLGFNNQKNKEVNVFSRSAERTQKLAQLSEGSAKNADRANAIKELLVEFFSTRAGKMFQDLNAATPEFLSRILGADTGYTARALEGGGVVTVPSVIEYIAAKVRTFVYSKALEVPVEGTELIVVSPSYFRYVPKKVITRKGKDGKLKTSLADDPSASPRSLSWMKIADGPEGKQVQPAEILVPEGFGNIGERVICTRTPSSAPHMNFPAIIVGYTPREAGNIVIAPEQAYEVLGHDGDGDMLFVSREPKMPVETRTPEEFNHAVTKALAMSDRDLFLWHRQVFKSLTPAQAAKQMEGMTDEKIAASAQSIRKELSQKTAMVNYFDMQWAFFTDIENANMMVNETNPEKMRNAFDRLVINGKTMAELFPKDDRLFTADSKAKQVAGNRDQQDSISIAAATMKAFSLFGKLGITYSGITFPSFSSKKGKVVLSRIESRFDEDGRYNGHAINTLLNVALDDGKHRMMESYGMTRENMGYWTALAALGFDIENDPGAIGFFRHPVWDEINSRMSGDVFSKKKESIVGIAREIIAREQAIIEEGGGSMKAVEVTKAVISNGLKKENTPQENIAVAELILSLSIPAEHLAAAVQVTKLGTTEGLPGSIADIWKALNAYTKLESIVKDEGFQETNPGADGIINDPWVKHLVDTLGKLAEAMGNISKLGNIKLLDNLTQAIGIRPNADNVNLIVDSIGILRWGDMFRDSKLSDQKFLSSYLNNKPFAETLKGAIDYYLTETSSLKKLTRWKSETFDGDNISTSPSKIEFTARLEDFSKEELDAMAMELDFVITKMAEVMKISKDEVSMDVLRYMYLAEGFSTTDRSISNFMTPDMMAMMKSYESTPAFQAWTIENLLDSPQKKNAIRLQNWVFAKVISNDIDKAMAWVVREADVKYMKDTKSKFFAGQTARSGSFSKGFTYHYGFGRVLITRPDGGRYVLPFDYTRKGIAAVSGSVHNDLDLMKKQDSNFTARLVMRKFTEGSHKSVQKNVMIVRDPDGTFWVEESMEDLADIAQAATEVAKEKLESKIDIRISPYRYTQRTKDNILAADITLDFQAERGIKEGKNGSNTAQAFNALMGDRNLREQVGKKVFESFPWGPGFMENIDTEVDALVERLIAQHREKNPEGMRSFDVSINIAGNLIHKIAGPNKLWANQAEVNENMIEVMTRIMNHPKFLAHFGTVSRFYTGLATGIDEASVPLSLATGIPLISHMPAFGMFNNELDKIVLSDQSNLSTEELMKPEGQQKAVDAVMERFVKYALPTETDTYGEGRTRVEFIGTDLVTGEAMFRPADDHYYSLNSRGPAVTGARLKALVNRISKAFPNVKVEFDTTIPTLGVVRNGKVIINPNLAKADTPAHEFGHVWLLVLKHNDPATYAEVLEKAKNTPEYKKAEEEYGDLPYSSEEQREETLLQEAYTNGLGEIALREPGIWTRIWNSISRSVGSLLQKAGIIKQKNLRDMTFAEITEKIYEEITSGKTVSGISSETLALVMGDRSFNQLVGSGTKEDQKRNTKIENAYKDIDQNNPWMGMMTSTGFDFTSFGTLVTMASQDTTYLPLLNQMANALRLKLDLWGRDSSDFKDIGTVSQQIEDKMKFLERFVSMVDSIPAGGTIPVFSYDPVTGRTQGISPAMEEGIEELFSVLEALERNFETLTVGNNERELLEDEVTALVDELDQGKDDRQSLDDADGHIKSILGKLGRLKVFRKYNQWQMNVRTLCLRLTGKENSRLQKWMYDAFNDAKDKSIEMYNDIKSELTGAGIVKGDPNSTRFQGMDIRNWGFFTKSRKGKVQTYKVPVPAMGFRTSAHELNMTRSEFIYLNMLIEDSQEIGSPTEDVIDYIDPVSGVSRRSGLWHLLQNGFEYVDPDTGKTEQVKMDYAQLMAVRDFFYNHPDIIENRKVMESYINGRKKMQVMTNITRIHTLNVVNRFVAESVPVKYKSTETAENKKAVRMTEDLEMLRGGHEAPTRQGMVQMQDVFKTMMDEAKMVSTYAAYSIPIRNLKKIRADGRFNKAVNESYADAGMLIDQYIASMESYVVETPASTLTNKTMSAFYQKYIISKLGFSPFTALKGLGGLALAATEIDWRHIQSAMDKSYFIMNGKRLPMTLRFFSPKVMFNYNLEVNPEAVEEMKAVGAHQLVERMWGSDQNMEIAELKAMMSNELTQERTHITFNLLGHEAKWSRDVKIGWMQFNKGNPIFPSVTSIARKASLGLVKNFDVESSMAGILNVDRMHTVCLFLAAKNEIMEANPSLSPDASAWPADMQEKLRLRAEEVIFKSQPSFDGKDKPFANMSNSEMWRIVSIFGSQVGAVYNVMYRSMYNYLKDPTPENKKKFMHGFVGGMMFNMGVVAMAEILKAITMGGLTDDDEEKWDDIARFSSQTVFNSMQFFYGQQYINRMLDAMAQIAIERKGNENYFERITLDLKAGRPTPVMEVPLVSTLNQAMSAAVHLAEGRVGTSFYESSIVMSNLSGIPEFTVRTPMKLINKNFQQKQKGLRLKMSVPDFEKIDPSGSHRVPAEPSMD